MEKQITTEEMKARIQAFRKPKRNIEEEKKAAEERKKKRMEEIEKNSIMSTDFPGTYK